MLGAIAGDIIGSVYETRPIKTPHFYPLFDPLCHPTDDTVLSVALADTILHRGDFAVRKALEHDEKERCPLLLDQRGKRALYVARTGLGLRRVGRVVFFERHNGRAARQCPQPIAVEIGQNGVEPTAHIAAVKQMLGSQGAMNAMPRCCAR